MMCARCEELEERVAWLESELGLQKNAEDFRRFHAVLYATRRAKRSGEKPRNQPAEILLTLYHAKGRPVSVSVLEERVSSYKGDDRDSNFVRVLVCMARKLVGSDAIANVYGRGYRLTDVGMQRVKEILDAA